MNLYFVICVYGKWTQPEKLGTQGIDSEIGHRKLRCSYLQLCNALQPVKLYNACALSNHYTLFYMTLLSIFISNSNLFFQTHKYNQIIIDIIIFKIRFFYWDFLLGKYRKK